MQAHKTFFSGKVLKNTPLKMFNAEKKIMKSYFILEEAHPCLPYPSQFYFCSL